MALLSTQVLPDNTLEEFRIEFNKLVTDVSGLSLGNTFDVQIIFEGTTDDTFETAISVTDPTADRSIVFPNASGNVLLDSTNIALADSIEIQLGDGTDLKIFHDGSNSIIRDNGTGALFLEGDTVSIRDEASGETMANFASDGAVTLYHDNAVKIATASTGVTITGEATATGFTGTLDGILGSGAAAAATVTTLNTSGVVNLNLTTDSSSSTSGALIIDGGVGVAKKLFVGTDFDVSGNSVIDGTALVTGVLTTTAATVFNGGFASNADSTMGTNKKIIFRDAAIHISSTADGDLSIAADDEIDITSTLIDINGNVDISGTTLMTGVATHGGNVVSDTDSTDDLGTTGVRWANLYVDAITATDQITATGFTGTLDGILGSGAAAAATTTTLACTTLSTSGAVIFNEAGADVDFRVEGDADPHLIFADASVDRVGIGGADTSLFNGAGTSAKLAVVGSSNNTSLVQNGGAAIAIVNTDQTDENTAGLHFARADTDDTPNYAGASIVAQFKETQATGQYPSTTLSFLTSPSQNAAPTTKMTLNEAGDLALILDKSIIIGAGSDLTIKHDGTNSSIKNTTGDLYIEDAGGNIYIQAKSGEQSIVAFADGSVDLYHDNSKKFETTSTGVTVTGDTLTTSINSGPLGGRRNVVFNGNGAVNQRFGTSANSTINTYGPDRWRTFGGALAHSVSSKSDAGEGDGYYIRFQRTASDSQTNSTGIAQGLETKDSKHLAGQEITVSFRARAGANWSPSSGRLVCQVAGGEGTDENHVSMTNTDIIISVNADMSTGSSFATFSGSATVPSDKTQISIRFSMTPTGTAGANDYFDIRNIQLEVGGRATTFEQRQIGEELGLCQRYCTVVVPATSTAVGNGFARTTTTAYASRPLPVLMRATPTITFSSDTDFQVQSRARVDQTTDMATSECGPDTIAFVATIGAANLVAGDGMYIRDNDGGATITADAEL